MRGGAREGGWVRMFISSIALPPARCQGGTQEHLAWAQRASIAACNGTSTSATWRRPHQSSSSGWLEEGQWQLVPSWFTHKCKRESVEVAGLSKHGQTTPCGVDKLDLGDSSGQIHPGCEEALWLQCSRGHHEHQSPRVRVVALSHMTTVPHLVGCRECRLRAKSPWQQGLVTPLQG